MDLIYFLILFIIQILRTIYRTDQSKDMSSLKLVQVVFRHGERNPLNGFGLDLKSESDWPGGFGQLTEAGKRQSIELGRYIRQRYDGFLKSSYNYKEIYVRSSDIDRTLATAQGVLMGLYPYTKNDLTNFGIPVHTTEKSNDKFNGLYSCPAINKFMNKGLMTTRVYEIIDKNKDVADYILKTTGDANFTYQTLAFLDNLKVQKAVYNKLPSNLDEKTFDKLMEIYLEAYNVMATYIDNDLRIGGALFKELVNHMTLKKSAAKEIEEKNIFIYSFHDVQITSILHMLGIDILDQIPETLATLFIELHAKTPDNYYVQLFYKNTTLSDPYELTIPGCPVMCPLETWEKIISTEKFKDLDKLCN